MQQRVGWQWNGVLRSWFLGGSQPTRAVLCRVFRVGWMDGDRGMEPLGASSRLFSG